MLKMTQRGCNSGEILPIQMQFSHGDFVEPLIQSRQKSCRKRLRKDRGKLRGLINPYAFESAQDELVANPDWMGTTQTITFLAHSKC